MHARFAWCGVLVGVFAATAPLSAGDLPLNGGGWDSYTASEPIISVPLGYTWAPRLDLSLDALYLVLRNATGEPLSAEEYSELARFRPFDTAGSNENILALFSAVRRSVLDAIHLIGYDDPKLADFLFWLYLSRRLNLADGSNFRVDAILRDDGRSAYGDEALNLQEFPCFESGPTILKYYDPNMVVLFNLLLYQSLLAVSPGYQGPFPTTQTAWAQWSLAQQIREAAAAAEEVARLDALILVLQSIISNAVLPASSQGFSYRIGDFILKEAGLTIDQKKDIARGLLLLLEGELRPRAEFNRQQRLFYQAGLQYFLSGLITQAVYNQFMKPTAWYMRTMKRDTGEFRRITLLTGSGYFNNPAAPQLVTETHVRQIAARADGTKVDDSFTIPELANISGAWRSGNNFIAAGNSTNTQEGILRGFLDTNNDGRIEANTGREVLRSSQFYGGLNLFRNQMTGAVMGFNRTSNKIFEFTGSDTDGFPTGFVDRGVITSGTSDLLYARLSYNSDWAIGYSDYKLPTNKFSLNLEAKYNPNDGKYNFFRRSFPWEEAELNVALGEVPMPGSTYLEASGKPGRQINAYQIDAGMTLLDQSQVDPNGHVVFNFVTGLVGNEHILLKDLTSNAFSPTYTIPWSIAPRFIGVRSTGDRAIQFEAFGRPEYDYTFQYGTFIGSTKWAWAGGLSRTGRSTWETSLDDFNRLFVTGAVIAPPLTGNADYYRVAPGARNEYHPQINDRYPLGTSFSLVSPTNLNAERLSFSAFGSFYYAALTTEAGFSLTYKLTLGQQNSANVMAVLHVDYQSLVNPPVQRPPGAASDNVQVPCLVIGGKHYPMYQFFLANNPADNCGEPHWHRPAGAMVYPLETPTSGITDPNPPGCGFGTVAAVPQENFAVSVTAWTDFKAAHTPPF